MVTEMLAVLKEDGMGKKTKRPVGEIPKSKKGGQPKPAHGKVPEVVTMRPVLP
ncbi:MAG TPA: hypothetical protein VGL53_26570 [Bryobacteraceae bacterium]|jgi:hypothetical protein